MLAIFTLGFVLGFSQLLRHNSQLFHNETIAGYSFQDEQHTTENYIHFLRIGRTNEQLVISVLYYKASTSYLQEIYQNLRHYCNKNCAGRKNTNYLPLLLTELGGGKCMNLEALITCRNVSWLCSTYFNYHLIKINPGQERRKQNKETAV